MAKAKDVTSASFRNATIKSCNDIIVRMKNIHEHAFSKSKENEGQMDLQEMIAFANGVAPIITLHGIIDKSGYIAAMQKAEEILLKAGVTKESKRDMSELSEEGRQ